MPRGGPRRIWFGGRLFTPAEQETVQGLAVAEMGGNLSGMVRRLVLEALRARGVADSEVAGE